MRLFHWPIRKVACKLWISCYWKWEHCAVYAPRCNYTLRIQNAFWMERECAYIYIYPTIKTRKRDPQYFSGINHTNMTTYYPEFVKGRFFKIFCSLWVYDTFMVLMMHVHNNRIVLTPTSFSSSLHSNLQEHTYWTGAMISSHQNTFNMNTCNSSSIFNTVPVMYTLHVTHRAFLLLL